MDTIERYMIDRNRQDTFDRAGFSTVTLTRHEAFGEPEDDMPRGYSTDHPGWAQRALDDFLTSHETYHRRRVRAAAHIGLLLGFTFGVSISLLAARIAGAL